MRPVDKESLITPTLSLMTSVGTLVCCALPAIMVTLGAGAALAGLVSAIPQLVWLSEHKVLVFSVAGAMIVASGIIQWNNRNAPCPVDPDKARACMRLRKISAWMYWTSVIIFAIGYFFAFWAVKIFY